jgi:hypothetical protein
MLLSYDAWARGVRLERLLSWLRIVIQTRRLYWTAVIAQVSSGAGGNNPTMR